MAFNADDLRVVEDALRTLAMGQRITEMRFSDRVMRYESATVNDLLKLRDQVKAEIAAQRPRQGRMVRLFHAGKGM